MRTCEAKPAYDWLQRLLPRCITSIKIQLDWVSRVPRSLENLTWHYDWQKSASKSSFSVKLSIEKFATDAFRVTQPVDPWSNDQELERGRKKISLAFKWDLFDQNQSRTAFRGIYYVHLIGSVWRARYYADLLGTTNCTSGCTTSLIFPPRNHHHVIWVRVSVSDKKGNGQPYNKFVQ